MTSSLLPILPAIDDILFNFAQSDGLSQANQVNSARNQRLTATVVFLDAGVTDYQSLQAGVIPEVATVILTFFTTKSPDYHHSPGFSWCAGMLIFRELSTQFNKYLRLPPKVTELGKD